jgi:tetratricopeptide (TPR) repeat protein
MREFDMVRRCTNWRGVCALTAVAASLAPAHAVAQSAVTVFGASPARACYDAARKELGGTIDDCDTALADETLTQRDVNATLVNRGVILNRLGRPQEAIADFNVALANDPDFAEALLNRGNAKFLLQDYTGAIADYEATLETDFDQPEVCWHNIGLAQKASGDLAAAKTSFIRATSFDADFAPARRQLAAIAAAESEAEE